MVCHICCKDTFKKNVKHEVNIQFYFMCNALQTVTNPVCKNTQDPQHRWKCSYLHKAFDFLNYNKISGSC